MGLDMYAYTLPKDAARPPVDFDIDNIPDWERRNLHYWRKHPNLHGWMAGLFFEKGGENPDFNCNTVEITPDDLDALERVSHGCRYQIVLSGMVFGASTRRRSVPPSL